MKIARIVKRYAALAAGIAFAFVVGRYVFSIATGRMRLTGEDFIGEVAT